MESGTTKSFDSQLVPSTDTIERGDDRLSFLLKANAEIAESKAKYPTLSDKLDAMSMRHPLTYEQTFSYLGALGGSLPLFGIFLAMTFGKSGTSEGPLFIILMVLTTSTTALVGYFSGRLVGKAVRWIGRLGFTPRILLLTLVGLLWGAVSGGAGGLFLFILGAVVGAIIGAAAGALALPLFSIPFFFLVKGDHLDRRHFLPIAVGISGSFAAFFLGFLYR